MWNAKTKLGSIISDIFEYYTNGGWIIFIPLAIIVAIKVCTSLLMVPY